jgi:hypothetical protein
VNWWHWWHTWVPVSVQHGRLTIARTAVTVVLDRCWCGKTRTRELIGQWTPEEVGIPHSGP